ncbi:MAG TPA: 4Fe-4S dicluster domain-containing protein [Armatimonadota bacterium]|nr:4Fe-4S dicluster domain-containing protein [Armatimonadota bacterium]
MSRPRAATVRRVSQGLFIAAFLSLFALTVWPSGLVAPVAIFLQTDPLVVLTALLAARAWVAAVALLALPVIVLTLLAGRAYCGWICPLGTCIDVSDRLFFARARRRPAAPRRRWKYYALAAVVASSLFGAQAAYLLDPMVLLTRTATLALFAPMAALIGAIGRIGGIADAYSSLLRRLDLPAALGLLPPQPAVFREGWLALMIFVGVLALGAVEKRFWCRNLCPLGALLGVISRAPLIRRRVNDRCTSCMRCVLECPTGAIDDEDPKRHRIGDCIQCYKCTVVCPEQAIRFRPQARRAGSEARLDLSRRRLLAFGAMGLGWAAMAQTVPQSRSTVIGNPSADAHLIRPPGSLPEPEFLDRCVRCQQCVKACPTNGLQPALAEAGFDGWWTPVLVPRIGPCSQHCNLCGAVCATHAIQPFRVQDKEAIFIGQAIIDRSSCIVWAADKTCLVCDEVCPYDAIDWKIVEGEKRPVVNEHVCTGCGECEKNCPVQPLAAIRVFSLGDRRHWGRPRQRQWRYGRRSAE